MFDLSGLAHQVTENLGASNLRGCSLGVGILDIWCMKVARLGLVVLSAKPRPPCLPLIQFICFVREKYDAKLIASMTSDIL